jgi:hypothetical protein
MVYGVVMSEAAKPRGDEAMGRLVAGASSFADRLRSQAGVDVRELIDPDGESVASLVDVEGSAGAAALAVPIDVITFDSWVLGNIGDRDELDLDVGSHRDLWFSFGAWIGEALRMRHGGFWLLPSEDPMTWRLGFSKILLEIAPHVFAERLLKAGQGMTRRMLAEIERIRSLHDEQADADGGKAKDRYAPQHYARLHTVPLAQWMVLDMATVSRAWAQDSAAALRALVATEGKKLPPQNAPILAKVDETLGKLEADKPAAQQTGDRGLYEAVAQIVGLRRATAPVAVDILEKIVLPALHMGVPDKFPPLGEDDVANIKKGTDLFAVMVDVVPFQHQAQEGGFLSAFTAEDMTTPYADRGNLELGKGDWVGINAGRVRPLLDKLDPNKLLLAFERFVEYAGKQPGVPRLGEVNRALAESTARCLMDLRAALGALGEGKLLVFRLLPPPS